MLGRVVAPSRERVDDGWLVVCNQGGGGGGGGGGGDGDGGGGGGDGGGGEGGGSSKLCTDKITAEQRAWYDALTTTNTSVKRLHALGRHAD